MRFTASIVVAAMLTGSAISRVVVEAQVEPGRRIGRDTRYTIASQLRPDDRNVIFEYNGDRPMMVGGPPRGGSRVDWLAQRSEVIIAIRVESIQPHLVHRDLAFNEHEVSADEANWIVSTVHARVEDVIKGGETLGREGGQPLSLKMEGGSAMIRGVHVEAVVPWEIRMAVGGRYLLFGHMYNGQFVRDYGYAEAASTGLLTRMIRPVPDALGRPDVGVSDDVEQWPLPQAAMLIREAAKGEAIPPRPGLN